jgi:multiple sugar transport system substrate-binding protein
MKSLTRLAALAAATALATTACGSVNITASPSAHATAAVSVASAAVAGTPEGCAYATPTPAATMPRPGEIIEIGPINHALVRWFVGLGPGEDPAQILLEQMVVNDFNALQDKRTDGVEPIQLSLEVVQNDTAASILRQEIETCNTPDLIGPIGLDGVATFDGEFLDLTRLIWPYGTPWYAPELFTTIRSVGSGGLVGLPYAVYPSYIFYDKDLFDAAGLKYPPATVGDQYEMPDGSIVPWNWDTVRTIAMRLSLDKAGRNATDTAFDPAEQVQFGFEFQSTEGRRLGSAFGSGSFVGPDGRAQFPDAWKTAWSWYYDGIWRDHFIADATERKSALLNRGNVLNSGHAAMGQMSQWYLPTLASTVPGTIKRWDIAPMPANTDGATTDPIDVATFVIDKHSLVAARAFEAMSYLLSRPDLQALCGGPPGTGDRLAFYHEYVDPTLAEAFPGNEVNWQVALDMASYAPVPNQAAALPNNAKATTDYSKAFSALATTPGLDMNKFLGDITTALQADFDAAR